MEKRVFEEELTSKKAQRDTFTEVAALVSVLLTKWDFASVNHQKSFNHTKKKFNINVNGSLNRGNQVSGGQ